MIKQALIGVTHAPANVLFIMRLVIDRTILLNYRNLSVPTSIR